MSDTKRTIKQAIEALSIGKTSLYNHMKALGIKPKKEGVRSYLTDDQISKIRGRIKEITPNDQGATSERPTNDHTNNHTNDHAEHRKQIEDIYKKQIEELKTELLEGREQNRVLTLDLGRWEGVAKTLKEQNTKLLEQSESIDARSIQKVDNKINITGFLKRFFK